MSTTERAPLLSLEDIWRIMVKKGEADNAQAGKLMAEVRNFYEARIASGELRVVKKIEPRITPFRHASGSVHPESFCPDCGVNLAPYGIGSEFNYFNFCPGCGAQIANKP